MNNQKRILTFRTDLASECKPINEKKSGDGYSYSESKRDDIQISELVITSENGEKLIGKPRGRYMTLDMGRVWMYDDNTFKGAVKILADNIKSMVESLCPTDSPVLIAGLGNRNITPDAVGPQCVDHIHVTRHIKDLDPELYSSLGSRSVSAISPGVVGQTGIETFELIQGAAEHIGASLLIVIDALTARSVDRLATTVQLSDTGIAPGSGIGNHRKAINRETVGIPVMAVGTPTIVDSSTLVCDALERAGMTSYPEQLTEVLENARSFFVSLNESDIAIKELSRLIGTAMNTALLGVE